MLGLRIDVCTYEGLRTGVPTLLRLLDRHRVRASFFVTLGPDRSGRAILQALRPGLSQLPALARWACLSQCSFFTEKTIIFCSG